MKSNKLLASIAMSLLTIFTVSCSSNSSNPASSNNNNNNNGGSAGANQVVATIGGTTYTMAGTATLVSASGTTDYAISGVDTSGHSIVIAIVNVNSTGTYDIGDVISLTPPSSIGLAYNYTDLNNSDNDLSYNSTDSKGTKVGTIDFSTISSTSLVGTFSCTIPLDSGPSGAAQTMAITNGSFNVTVN